MQAIGIIETKGLLAIIEAADAMVKSANVNIIEKIYIGGGYVSVTITGDIGAVKSAVDAGVSAVCRLDEKNLVSHHVIARPHNDLKGIIETIPAIEMIEKAKREEGKASFKSFENSRTFDEVNVEETSIEEIVSKITKENNELEIEELDTELSLESSESDIKKEEMDKMVAEKGLEKSLEEINNLKVSKIRKLAKEYKDFGLTSKVISKVDKRTLIDKFEEYYKK